MMLGVNGAGTDSPTPPTNNPTTLQPSKSPTTLYPSFSPTTTRPTSTPTANPNTKDPTKTGTTKTPTTIVPTSHPTIATATPTANPTILTRNPTIKPTVFPTKAPTVTPPSTAPPSTAQPTTTPTTPTAQPTLPTAQPTNFPTNEPTNEPTAAPTTVAPTEAPTAAPTTVAPTEAPTTAPTTVEPTEAPSTAPTNEPTKAPTTVAPTTRAPTLENMKDICEFEVLKGNGNNPCGNGFKVQSALYGKVAEELGWYGRDSSAKCGFMRDAPKTEESSEEDDEESSEEEIKVCTVDVTDAFVKDDSRNLQKNHQVSFFLKEYCKDQTGNEYCDYGTTSTGGECDLTDIQKQLRVFCVLDEESGSEAGSEAEAEAEEAKCVCTTKGTKVFVYDGTDKCTFSGESPGMPCDSCCTTYLDKIELNGQDDKIEPKCTVAEENINKKLRSDGNFCVEASWVMISKRLAKLGSDMLNNDSGFPYFQWNTDNTCRVHNVEQAKELEVTAHYSCKKPQQN